MLPKPQPLMLNSIITFLYSWAPSWERINFGFALEYLPKLFNNDERQLSCKQVERIPANIPFDLTARPKAFSFQHLKRYYSSCVSAHPRLLQRILRVFNNQRELQTQGFATDITNKKWSFWVRFSLKSY